MTRVTEEGTGAALWGLYQSTISDLILGQWVLSKAPTAPMPVVGVCWDI